MDSWVLVPCQRSRLDMLKRLLVSLEHPADRVVIVATLPDPIKFNDVVGLADYIVLLSDYEQGRIARWWNSGLDYIRNSLVDQTKHEVLVLSSDNVGTPYSVAMLGVFLRQNNLTMVGPNPWHDHPRFFTAADTRGCHDRVPGGCWMLAGESGLRADEQFRWWYSDDDLEMQARQHGGAGIIPGTGLVGGPDTALSDEKQQWAIEDRAKFVTKWGKEPW